MNKAVLVLIVVLMPLFANGQKVTGFWKTVDDRTGKNKALVEVYTKGDKLYGKVRKILEDGKANALCEKCDGNRKDKPIEGMTIIGGLEKTGAYEWRGKDLFDPEQGQTFRCKIWWDPDNPEELKVRGYLAFLYRTQTWVRAENQ